MNRTVIKKRSLHDPGEEGPIGLDPATCLGAVWPLTCDAWSMTAGFDAEQPLRRTVVTVIRSTHNGTGTAPMPQVSA